MSDNKTSTIPGVEVSYELTDDIKPQWLNVIRRLQSVARRGNHYGILSIKILVDRDGHPIQWTEPQRTGIEPMSSDGLQKLIEDLTSTK
jgi:hypothetical protein